MVFALAAVSAWFLLQCQCRSCRGVGMVLASFFVDARACLFFLFWCCHDIPSLLLLLLLMSFLLLLLPQCGMCFLPRMAWLLLGHGMGVLAVGWWLLHFGFVTASEKWIGK